MFEYSFGLWGAISTVLSALFGGGLIFSLYTIRAQKKKANAEAKSSELTNVETAIKIWREMSVSLSDELKLQQEKSTELKIQVEKLSKEVNRLTCINSRILRLLDRITPDNIETTVQEIKRTMEKS